ncbi:unnamed protein product [Paramecium pentaurelia]|uniref:Uncharacterized protein n=1 Tax=Paramecium pentaurelia TaxID=43138 RepID=A0A8S1Y1B6_9CILI|nr:unnamed protein product [Paramecium pentaurelia]
MWLELFQEKENVQIALHYVKYVNRDLMIKQKYYFYIIQSKITPCFKINQENSIYTLKCIQKVHLQKVPIDPNLQIAHYSINEICDNMVEYNVLNFNNLGSFFLQNFRIFVQNINSGFLEQKLNYKYFNEIGLKRITLILLFNTICENLEVKNYSFLNYIREKVFSIQQIQLRIEEQLKPFLLVIQFQILYFDSVKINQVRFLIRTQLKLIFNNRGQSLDFNIIDTSFYSDQSIPIQIQIYGDNYRNFNLQNFQFFDVIVYNAINFLIMSSDLGDYQDKGFEIVKLYFQQHNFAIFSKYASTNYS